MLVVIQREYQFRETKYARELLRKHSWESWEYGRVLYAVFGLAVHVDELFHQGERGC